MASSSEVSTITPKPSTLTLSILERGQMPLDGVKIERIIAAAEGPNLDLFETWFQHDGVEGICFFLFKEGEDGSADTTYYGELGDVSVFDVVRGFCREVKKIGSSPTVRQNCSKITWLTIMQSGSRRHVLAELPDGIDLLSFELWQTRLRSSEPPHRVSLHVQEGHA